MFTPRFTLSTFDVLPLDGRCEVLVMMLEALVHANALYLRAYPRTPQLYASGVVYKHEHPLGSDDWQDIPRTLAVRSGDCEDLASWRVAELRASGQAASLDVQAYESPPGCSTNPLVTCLIDFHIRVRRADGTREDPSQQLGMR